MADHQTPAHLKAEMPQIPGVAGPRKSQPNPMLPLIIGLAVIGLEGEGVGAGHPRLRRVGEGASRGVGDGELAG